MSDIFREVEDDLRREQLKSLWNRIGPFVLAAAVLIVVGTGGWRAWEWYSLKQAQAEGDRFVAALQLAEEGKTDEAITALQAVATDGKGGYPVLARFRIASEYAAAGKTDDAVAAFDAIAASGETPAVIQPLARLRAALLLLDSIDLAAMKARIEPLAATGAPWRHSAREILGLSAWRAGDYAAARGYFDEIAQDPEAPQMMRQRVALMQELIRAKIGEAPAPAAS